MPRRFKIVYNPKGRWFPGSRAFLNTFETRTKAEAFKRRWHERHGRNDRQINNAKITSFESKRTMAIARRKRR